MKDREISRFYLDFSSSWLGYRLAVECGEDRGDGVRYVANIAESTKHEGAETVKPECVAGVSEKALVGLAQSLWDGGIRPREAINHEEALKALRSEVSFLRQMANLLQDDLRTVTTKGLAAADRPDPIVDALIRVADEAGS